MQATPEPISEKLHCPSNFYLIINLLAYLWTRFKKLNLRKFSYC